MSFAQGLRVIGTFIRCPVYNKPRGLDAKSACGSKRLLVIPEIMKMGAEGAVIIITGLHHFFLPDMISKLLSSTFKQGFLFDSQSLGILVVCRGLNEI